MFFLQLLLQSLLPLSVLAAKASKSSKVKTSNPTNEPQITTSTTTKPPATATTTTVETSNFCSTNNAILSCLDLGSAASAFCTSILSIVPETFTTTVTSTPLPVTFTTESTAAPNISTTTISVTGSPTTITTFTTTTTVVPYVLNQTTTIPTTCLTAAYRAPVASIQNREIQMRATPEAIAATPTTCGSSYISSICSCLSLPTPTSTTTITTTLPTQTVTQVQTITPSSTTTIYATILGANFFTTSTITVSVTSTTTRIISQPTIVVPGVLRYRQYQNNPPVNAYAAGAVYDPDTLKGRNPQNYGTLKSTNFADPYGWFLCFSSRCFADQQAAVLMQGFFVAPQDGRYTIQTDGGLVDNFNFLWTGEKAYTWNRNAQDYAATRVGDGPFNNGGSYSFVATKGDAIPMTFLWANGGGAAASHYTVITPGGVSQNLGGFFVPACEQGNPFI